MPKAIALRPLAEADGVSKPVEIRRPFEADARVMARLVAAGAARELPEEKPAPAAKPRAKPSTES